MNVRAEIRELGAVVGVISEQIYFETSSKPASWRLGVPNVHKSCATYVVKHGNMHFSGCQEPDYELGQRYRHVANVQTTETDEK